MSECSDPEMQINHVSLSSSEDDEQMHDEVAATVIEAFDRFVDTVDESTLVSWLMSRCQRRRDEAIDDDKREAYNDHVIALSTSWMDMCDNDAVPRPRLRGMLRDFARLSPRSGSPTAALSCDEVVGELLQMQSNVNSLESEAAELEAHNEDVAMPDADGGEDHQMDVDLNGIRNNTHEIGPEAEGPTYGPLDRNDTLLQEIHDQRARVLAEIEEHLAGPLTQEEQWYWEAQRDWWYAVP